MIRLSGPEAIKLTNQVFKGKNLEEQASHTLHFGTIRDGERIIDEVVAGLFVAPHSYTKENVVEISCHGSEYIIAEIIKLFLQKGARLAEPGEFTKRAFLNGQLDLAQAEAVADLISSNSRMSHEVALKQMRGGFSAEIKNLRNQLVHFASMIELELDFAEEDVEFADRDALRNLINKIQTLIRHLLDSFELGNVLKNGVPTVIVGKPNAGKSTLLNVLLNEEKAIVSDIPGTTRDFIEDEIQINGIRFRFIDTAGLRETEDKVEALGVARTYQKVDEAALVLYLFDINTTSPAELETEINQLAVTGKPVLPVANKMDAAQTLPSGFNGFENLVAISAFRKENIQALKDALVAGVKVAHIQDRSATIVTNLRHVASLQKTHQSLEDVLSGLSQGISTELVASDIRRALHALGEITGEITTDDLLENIFSKFCIGK